MCQPQLGTVHPVFKANTVIRYKQNTDFIINAGNIIMASVKVFDIKGRMIEDTNNANASQTSIKGVLVDEVLLV